MSKVLEVKVKELRGEKESWIVFTPHSLGWPIGSGSGICAQISCRLKSKLKIE